MHPLPADFDFLAMIHAVDKRIPVAALHFGTEAIFMALQRYGRAEALCTTKTTRRASPTLPT